MSALQKLSKTLLLAFDIERVNNRVVAIGAVLTNFRGDVIADYQYKGFFPENAAGKDYHEFWKNGHMETLTSLTYDGPLCSQVESEHRLVRGFQDFRFRCESEAASQGARLITVVDAVTDVTFVNRLIQTYIDEDGYMPYKAASKTVTTDDGRTTTTRSFDNPGLVLTSTLSAALRLMMQAEKAFAWNNERWFEETFGVPPLTASHDHNPINDALSIAEHAWRCIKMLHCRGDVEMYHALQQA